MSDERPRDFPAKSGAVADGQGSILYQHTVFCQTGLPYRDPGPGHHAWERSNGTIQLRIEAGWVLHPETHQWVQLGLPFGPQPRLILAHLNRQALIHGSPEIEVADSLTAFAKALHGYDPNGRAIRTLKDQLARLAASTIRMAAIRDGTTTQVEAKVVSAFDLWFPKDDRQRLLWPSTIRLSLDYFESLRRHAVPLDEQVVAELARSAMGLDIYAWLAQRLHRVEPARSAFVGWNALQGQFGWHYRRTRKFREVFRVTLDTVLAHYRGARIAVDERGMVLHHSPPPVRGRLAIISRR